MSRQLDRDPGYRQAANSHEPGPARMMKFHDWPASGRPQTIVLRQEGVALWRQIASHLQQDIGAGVHPPGGRLPTEAELSQHFAVNRHTVRRALEELSRGGLVRVEQGRGSFVAEDVHRICGRAAHAVLGMDPAAQQGAVRARAATEGDRGRCTGRRGLGIRAGARVVLLERLGLADGRPVSLTSHYFPPRGCAACWRRCARAPRITEALQAVGVADYLRQITRVTARLPSAEEAELLRMPRNRPLLVTENINVDRAGAVVEFGVGALSDAARADRLRTVRANQ